MQPDTHLLLSPKNVCDLQSSNQKSDKSNFNLLNAKFVTSESEMIQDTDFGENNIPFEPQINQIMCIEKTPKAAFFKSQSLSKPIRQLKGDRGTDKNTSMIRNLTSYEQKIFRTALDGIYDVTFNRLEKQKASTNSNIVKFFDF